MSDVSSPRRIPAFRLPASTGQTLGSDAWLGKVPMVIFFLPGLDSEVDRAEVLDFDRMLSDFGTERSQVLGVVKETARRVREIADEMDLHIPVLADAGGEMIASFGVDEPDGRARRATFVVDVDGRIVRRFDPAPPDEQAHTMLTAIRALKAGEIDAQDGTAEEPPA